ncbi:alpha/beta fold hydrolase [Bacillus suaedaesalsae]|uniref:Alpha/beta hydrolase n=1 Tax=Bacillus suaedaesalsae TaxID=2810349 RepID=A0ABS2DEY4_9BACI|nr:alpha/beta hydrolase [Bacillus suaedaesalsae]MBM6617016.1 alpha/beta hydrolase [Bacillus suaedaesalsae]
MEFSYNGNVLFYEKYGEGHPIVILHSMGTDHRSMKAWIEPIFEGTYGFERIYIDVPAHGKSIITADIQSTQQMVNGLLQFIENEIGSNSFSLIGHSFGGYLAQGIMNQKVDQVRGICLLAPALHLKERSIPDKVVVERDQDLLSSIEPSIRDAFETLFVYQNKGNYKLFLNEVQPGRVLADRDFLQSNWREKGYFLHQDPFENRTRLKQPALIILGKQDNICGYKDHLMFLEVFDHVTFSILDQAGHLMTIEQRKLVQELVSDWIINKL